MQIVKNKREPTSIPQIIIDFKIGFQNTFISNNFSFIGVHAILSVSK